MANNRHCYKVESLRLIGDWLLITTLQRVEQFQNLHFYRAQTGDLNSVWQYQQRSQYLVNSLINFCHLTHLFATSVSKVHTANSTKIRNRQVNGHRAEPARLCKQIQNLAAAALAYRCNIDTAADDWILPVAYINRFLHLQQPAKRCLVVQKCKLAKSNKTIMKR